jgi:hypothetical protein
MGDRLDRSGSGQGQVADSCECGNEPSGFIKCGKFLKSLKRVRFPGRTLLHVVNWLVRHGPISTSP